MEEPSRTNKTKINLIEINWKIREIFSETALSSFLNEINHQNQVIKEK